jgi:caffeoyl-CoA O-methyltransferase
MAESSAKLIIDRPERYAKQLASHIGHKAQAVEEIDGKTHITFGFGATGTIEVGDGAVILTATANDGEAMTKAQDVLGRHLLKFAKLEGQTLDWSTN